MEGASFIMPVIRYRKKYAKLDGAPVFATTGDLVITSEKAAKQTY